MEKLVEVSEKEVRIDFTLSTKCRTTIHLKSRISTNPIAFKVQTSSPHKFLVNPPSGFIPPLSSTTFQVILKPQTHLPTSFPRSPTDSFLIKIALAPQLTRNLSESTHSEFINSWFNSVPHHSIHDVKLKVALVGPFLLRHAVIIGDCVTVKKIVKRQRGVLNELTTREAESLLRVASELGNSDEMVSVLIESGLKCDTCVDLDEARWGLKGWTELHVGAVFDRTEEIERLIREGGCGPLDCGDKEGRTALHLAVSKGNWRCARVLLSAGAEVDARSNDGRTALYRAAASGDHRLVEMLMEMGADPMIGTLDRGGSAVEIARDKGHKEVVTILERGEAVLHAARRGDLNHLESLLEKDASVNFCDQYGLTALHVAAIKGYKDAVMMLVEFGADVESQDIEGHTPLHLAVESGSIYTVEVLINMGANVNAKSKKGSTPLHIARAMGYEDLSLLLLDKGAISTCPMSSSSSSLSSIL